MRWIIIFFSLLFFATCADGYDKALIAFQRGNAAFEMGFYHTSFVDYLYAAHQRLPQAEYALAFQYYYGLGTDVDEYRALIWLKRAANKSFEARAALITLEDHKPIMPWTICYKPKPRIRCGHFL